MKEHRVPIPPPLLQNGYPVTFFPKYSPTAILYYIYFYMIRARTPYCAQSVAHFCISDMSTVRSNHRRSMPWISWK